MIGGSLTGVGELNPYWRSSMNVEIELGWDCNIPYYPCWSSQLNVKFNGGRNLYSFKIPKKLCGRTGGFARNSNSTIFWDSLRPPGVFQEFSNLKNWWAPIFEQGAGFFCSLAIEQRTMKIIENHQFFVETNLPTLQKGRVYVKFPEATRYNYSIVFMPWITMVFNNQLYTLLSHFHESSW